MALTSNSNRVVATGDSVTTIFYFNRLGETVTYIVQAYGTLL